MKVWEVLWTTILARLVHFEAPLSMAIAYLSGITGLEETGTSIEDCGSSVSRGLWRWKAGSARAVRGLSIPMGASVDIL